MAHVISRFHSSVLQRMVKVIVFLPELDEQASKQNADTFPTLYLLHDLYGGAEDWSLYSAIERYAQESQLAVVMPALENSCGLDMAYGDLYASFVSTELYNVMNAVYPLSAQREDTFVAGCGFGGYGAILLGLKYPEHFAWAAAISGVIAPSFSSAISRVKGVTKAYWTSVLGNMQDVAGTDNDIYWQLDQRLNEKGTLPDLYLLCGIEDPFYADNLYFSEHCAKRGLTVYSYFTQGTNDWDFFDKSIRQVVGKLAYKA